MEIRSITKGLRLLEALASAPAPLGVTELARKLDLDKASVSRMLKTLEQSGFVAKDAQSQRFSLGTTLISMGYKALKRLSLLDCAKPALIDLVEKTGESAHLGILIEDRVFYLDQLAPQLAIGADLAVGSLVPVHCTALGKVLLAFQSNDFRDEIIGRLKFESYTNKTIGNARAFSEHLDIVKAEGVAHDDEEFSVGVRCIAAPIFRYDDTVCGAIGISGPVPRFTRAKLARWQDLLKEGAVAISRRMGHGQAD